MSADESEPDDGRPQDAPGSTTSAQPEPTVDAPAPVGPGGVDAVPDWEDADETAVVPDPPRSAQVSAEGIPDDIESPEETAEPDSAGAGEDSPSGTEEPSD